MTNERPPDPGTEPGVDERIAEFAGSLSYPPGYLERERRSWDRGRHDIELEQGPDTTSGAATPV